MNTDAAVARTCLICCMVHFRIADHDRSHTECSATCNTLRPVFVRRRTWDDVGHIDVAGCSFGSCTILHIAGIAGCRRSNNHTDSHLENLELDAFVGKVEFVDQTKEDWGCCCRYSALPVDHKLAEGDSWHIGSECLVQKIRKHCLSAVGHLETDRSHHSNYDIQIEYRVAELQCNRKDNHSVPK